MYSMLQIRYLEVYNTEMVSQTHPHALHVRFPTLPSLIIFYLPALVANSNNSGLAVAAGDQPVTLVAVS